MRWALNRLALAITSMVALAFLVPLVVATRQIAHDRAVSEASLVAHTPEGVAFRVTVSASGLLVDDAGPGILDPAEAVRRGVSGAGSTGLGVDIVRKAANAVGGRLVVAQGPLGGARVGIFF